MGVGMGGREALAPRIVKMLVKKGYFLVSSGKNQLLPILAPTEKFWKNTLVPPLEKSFRRPWVCCVMFG